MSNKPEITPDHIARMVMLVYGTMSDANPFWCFVSVKPSQYANLQKLVAEKNLDLRNYGIMCKTG
jgi:hypothetical protein